MLSATVKTCKDLLVHPSDWEFHSKWRPKGGEIDIWKLKMSNFLRVAPPGGQTIDRLIKGTKAGALFYWFTYLVSYIQSQFPSTSA